MDNSDHEMTNESVVNSEVSAVEEAVDSGVVDSPDGEKMVPLSVVQKERKKRQQVQQELDSLKSTQRPPDNAEEDLSGYESVTRDELGANNAQLQRLVREETWSDRNPEKAIFVEQELENFLQSRPNLAPAISNATNRVQEAWELMNALSGNKNKVVKKTNRTDAPLSPGTVPKGAALNETTDVMNMSDQEFNQWRKSKRRAR